MKLLAPGVALDELWLLQPVGGEPVDERSLHISVNLSFKQINKSFFLSNRKKVLKEKISMKLSSKNSTFLLHALDQELMIHVFEKTHIIQVSHVVT